MRELFFGLLFIAFGMALGGCQRSLPVDDYMPAMFVNVNDLESLFRDAASGDLLFLVRSAEKKEGSMCLRAACPCHGFPDRALQEYTEKIATLSTNLILRTDNVGSNVCTCALIPSPDIARSFISCRSMERALAIVGVGNPLPRECKYWMMVESLRKTASRDIVAVVMKCHGRGWIVTKRDDKELRYDAELKRWVVPKPSP